MFRAVSQTPVLRPFGMSSAPAQFRIILTGFGALAIAMGIGRFVFTPLLPLMQEDRLIGIAEGGLLASVHFLGYWLGAVFAGRLPWAPKTVFRLSLVTVALSTLGMGATESFAAWSVLRFVCGVSSAFVLVLVSNFHLRRLAETGHGVGQGWVFSGVGAGIAFTGLVTLAVMASETGSAEAWLLFGAISLVAASVLCAATGSEFGETQPSKISGSTTTHRLDWALLAAYGAAGIGYSIPATYLPVLARDVVQSEFVFGWAWPVFGAAALISTLLATRLQTYWSNRRIWAASQLVLALGVGLPIVSAGIASIIFAGFCVGGTFMIITMMGMKEVHRTMPVDQVMRSIAAMTAAFAGGQMLGPVAAGALHDLTGGFEAALLATAALLVATAAILIVGGIGRTADGRP